MKGSLKLGRISGIGIYLHWSFVILIVYVIFSNYRLGQAPAQIAWSLLFVLSIFATVVLHELGHALTAKRYGIKTRDITLLPIGGLARLEKLPEKPSEELAVALAGPAVNIALALLTLVFTGLPKAPELVTMLGKGLGPETFFLNFFIVNLWLAVFNLIPAFPMDGGRVLRALLAFRLERTRATRIAARIGQLIAIGFVITGFFSNPFLVIIGIFIFIGAQAEAEITQAQASLKGHKVKDALMLDFVTLDADEQLQLAISILLNGPHKSFVITQNGHPAGVLGRDEIIRALQGSGSQVKLGEIMNRHPVVLSPEDPLEEAYKAISAQKPALMLIMEQGRLAGTLDAENILELIMIKQAKETKP